MWLRPSWSDENNFEKKLLGLSYRLSKTILFDDVFDHLAFLIQHEIFGHGARYREFGYTDNSYRLHLIFPYGDSKGWAFTGTPDPLREVSSSESLLMTIGGFEAESLLSQEIYFRWVERGAIHYRETLLYLFSSLNLSSYIIRTKYNLSGEEGNDVLNYLRKINSTSGIPESPEDPLTIDDLAVRTLVSAVNPFVYFSLCAYFYHYLWEGRETMLLPMIRIGRFKVLPFFRFSLAPYGTEFYFETYAAFPEKTARFYIRYGSSDFKGSRGGGLSIGDLIKSPEFSLRARMDIWNQPALVLGGETTRETRSGLGGAIFCNLFYKLTRGSFIMGITADIGYKTEGYLEGEKLGRGMIFRAGLGFLE